MRLAAVGDRAQTIEDTLANLTRLYDIRTAYGYWADQIGSLLDQPRYEQADAVYRVFLRARGQTIKRRRTMEDTLSLIRILLNDDSRDFEVVDTYPKAYKVIIENLTLAEVAAFREFLRLSKPATYNGKFIVTVADAFGFVDKSGIIPGPPPPYPFGDITGTYSGAGKFSYIVPF